MLIRPETAADRAAVDALHRSAFGERGPVVVGLLDDLRAAEHLSLLAAEDDEVLGSIVFSPALLDAPARPVEVVTLSPLAVAPAHQRAGVGTALVTEGLREWDSRGVPLVFLEGDPRYYGRFGFRAGVDLGLRRPSLRIPEPGFQARPMTAYEPWMTGTLVYRDVFWRNDCVGLRP